MITLRDAHLDAFQQVSLKQFEDRMVDHLRNDFADRTKDRLEPDLRSLVRDSVAKAKTYGVVAEDDVQRFIDCRMIYGPEFDTAKETHWAGQILRTPSLNGTEKMDYVEKFGRERVKKSEPEKGR
ncbi:MAG: hypothetical protein Q8N47_21915 [Bryobacterales bacterium]|nr:hypothetical protein [Bryobacterales bacterium]